MGVPSVAYSICTYAASSTSPVARACPHCSPHDTTSLLFSAEALLRIRRYPQHQEAISIPADMLTRTQSVSFC
jgi:hypothetical protein